MNVTELDIEVFNYSELRELKEGSRHACTTCRRSECLRELDLDPDLGEADCCSSAAAGASSRTCCCQFFPD